MVILYICIHIYQILKLFNILIAIIILKNKIQRHSNIFILITASKCILLKKFLDMLSLCYCRKLCCYYFKSSNILFITFFAYRSIFYL